MEGDRRQKYISVQNNKAIIQANIILKEVSCFVHFTWVDIWINYWYFIASFNPAPLWSVYVYFKPIIILAVIFLFLKVLRLKMWGRVMTVWSLWLYVFTE